MDERLIWEGTPSQLSRLGYYLVCLVCCWLLFPIPLALWQWWRTETYRITLTGQRVVITAGTFTRKAKEYELYKVSSFRMEEPILLQLFNLSNLYLITPRGNTLVMLPGIKNGVEVMGKIRLAAAQAREGRVIIEV